MILFSAKVRRGSGEKKSICFPKRKICSEKTVFVRSVGGDRRSILEYCSFLIGFWVDFLNRIHEVRRMGGVLAKGLWRAQCGFFGEKAARIFFQN
ncbi:hypothetical protein [Thermodesulfomicrobium sp. WS]|uniref:hypothetical protein n=1 Tax=Thermodesulfomicrobium sp. WS TaxID=3004129 RepID=UPI00249350D9|nr:hypothetical protein [Thermodesulfomicrobium sp. WS]